MKKRTCLILLFLLTSIACLFSFYHIVLWYLENNKTESETKWVQDITPIKVITLTDKEEEVEKFVSADFTEIAKVNTEVKGWINIPNTAINYPIVQHNDNAYYLTHSFDNKKNKAGWIFMDYRNTGNEKNTIIYGHNRLDGSMFGSLSNLTDMDYLKNKEHILYISTPTANYVYEIFSIYRIDTTDDYIQINFEDAEYQEWLKKITNRSLYNFQTTVTSEDKIITLSTCYKHVKKLVVHAKLINTQIREK